MSSFSSKALLCAAAASAFALPALAQDRDAFRAQARERAAQIRRLGDPKDRCSLGTFITEGGYVVDVYGASPLLVGDRLLRLNGADTTTMTIEQAGAILRSLAPDAHPQVTVRRGSEEVTVEVTCQNARPASEAMLAAYDFAGNGRFDDCVRAIGSRIDVSFPGRLLKFQCAANSRSPERHNVGQLAYDAAHAAVTTARWRPDSRPLILQQLRNMEAMITQAKGPAAFQELVAITQTWEGSENAWRASTPDWSLFRRNAEAALRRRLIDPDSARIEWPNGFLLGTWKPLLQARVEGYWTCGLINARNRMGGYTGSTSFVVVLSPQGEVKFSDVGSGRDLDIVSSSCQRSASQLPPAPAAWAAATGPGQGGSTGAPSLATEIERLVQLRDSGALTQAEFEAAKAKLLAPPSS
jgi:hypothetical protein